MNCWNTLRAEQYHNATGNSNRDGLKNCRIGQSAAKPLKRGTFNDYPVREYTQVGGRMIQPHHPINAADDIVFSAWKHAAVRTRHSDGFGNNEPKRKYKAYLGDDYYALAWPSTLRTFKNNLETIHQYSDTGFKLIMNGEIGRYENTRYVEQTNIAKGIGTDGITQTPWSQGKSDWIFFFGNDTVAEAIAVPEEMRGGYLAATIQ